MRVRAGGRDYQIKVVDSVVDSDNEPTGQTISIDTDVGEVQIKGESDAGEMLERFENAIRERTEFCDVPNQATRELMDLLPRFHAAGGINWLMRESASFKPIGSEPFEITDHPTLQFVPDDWDRPAAPDPSIEPNASNPRTRSERRVECPRCQKSIVVNAMTLKMSSPFYDFHAHGHFTRCHFECSDCNIRVKFKCPWPFDPEEPIDSELDPFEIEPIHALAVG